MGVKIIPIIATIIPKKIFIIKCFLKSMKATTMLIVKVDKVIKLNPFTLSVFAAIKFAIMAAIAIDMTIKI